MRPRQQSFGDQRRRVICVRQQRERAVEMRAAAVGGNVAQCVEQLVDIRVRIAVLAGVTRGVQARRAIECVDADAGIIAERRQARRACGMARLDQRVLDEAQPGLVGVGDAEIALRDQFDARIGEHCADLAELARIAARKNDTAHAQRLALLRGIALQPSASRCFASSSPMPFCARASSRSSSSRRNAWPSAVPCSSMKPPPSFITTLKSVSQAESSG